MVEQNMVLLCPIRTNCTIIQIQESNILHWASLLVMRMLINDMARKITEDRFSLNRGDESRACYTCNAYSGQRLHITCRCATGEIDHNFQEAVIYKMNKNFLLPISLLVCATLYSYNIMSGIKFKLNLCHVQKLLVMFFPNQCVHPVGKSLKAIVMDLYQDL